MKPRCPTLGCEGRGIRPRPPRRSGFRATERAQPHGVGFNFDIVAWSLSGLTAVPVAVAAFVTLVLENGSLGTPAASGLLTLLLAGLHFIGVPSLLHAQKQRALGSTAPWAARFATALAYTGGSLLVVCLLALLGFFILGSGLEHGLGAVAGFLFVCLIPGLSNTIAARVWVDQNLEPEDERPATRARIPESPAHGLSIRVRAREEQFLPTESTPAEPVPVGHLISTTAPAEPNPVEAYLLGPVELNDPVLDPSEALLGRVGEGRLDHPSAGAVLVEVEGAVPANLVAECVLLPRQPVEALAA